MAIQVTDRGELPDRIDLEEDRQGRRYLPPFKALRMIKIRLDRIDKIYYSTKNYKRRIAGKSFSDSLLAYGNQNVMMKLVDQILKLINSIRIPPKAHVKTYETVDKLIASLNTLKLKIRQNDFRGFDNELTNIYRYINLIENLFTAKIYGPQRMPSTLVEMIIYALEDARNNGKEGMTKAEIEIWIRNRYGDLPGLKGSLTSTLNALAKSGRIRKERIRGTTRRINRYFLVT